MPVLSRWAVETSRSVALGVAKLAVMLVGDMLVFAVRAVQAA